MRVVIYLIAAAVALGVATAQDYCTKSKDHTMCIYKKDAASGSCGKVVARGVATSEQKIIVDKHNELRARVAGGQERLGSNGGQPGATNMQQLKWDKELATVAQRWVDQCDYGHDKSRAVQRFGVGQNVATTSDSQLSNKGKADWPNAVQMWYDEVKDFNKKDISPFKFSEKSGHYTQVAWADTNLVGCGYIFYEDASDPEIPYTAYYGCNYGPAGNVRDTTMYKTGTKPCSQCSNSAAGCDNNLCA